MATQIYTTNIIFFCLLTLLSAAVLVVCMSGDSGEKSGGRNDASPSIIGVGTSLDLLKVEHVAADAPTQPVS